MKARIVSTGVPSQGALVRIGGVVTAAMARLGRDAGDLHDVDDLAQPITPSLEDRPERRTLL